MRESSVSQFPCPMCHRRLTAAPILIGRCTICPACHEPLIVPRPSTVPTADRSEARFTRSELRGCGFHQVFTTAN